MSNLPKLKRSVLTERMTLSIDKETKDTLSKLKFEKGVDVSELVRLAIKEKLETIKAS